MLSDLDSRDPLRWLSRILWPDGSVTIAPSSKADHRTGPAWWASPSPEAAKILIPADAPAAARTAVRRYHDGFSTTRRIRSAVAEAMMVNEKIAGFGLRNKLVAAAASPDPSTAGDSMPPTGLLGHIRDLMDTPDLVVAVSLSTPKSNQKPVLQLLDQSGGCLGWAKVAWNDRTDALVGTEAFWLQRAGDEMPKPRPGAPATVLSMPTLLHDSVFDGRRVVVTSGVRSARLPRRSPSSLPPLAVFQEVHALGSVDNIPISESPWWQSVAAVLPAATPRERTAIETAIDRAKRLRFQVGAWHGDLTPWNLMTAGRSVQLIDWEFAADGVPLGFDLCHFHTQVAAEMQDRDGAQALTHSARMSPQGLAALGVDAENRTATWNLYLVELIRRLLALRNDGYPTEAVTHGPAALERLEHALGLSGVPAAGNGRGAASIRQGATR